MEAQGLAHTGRTHVCTGVHPHMHLLSRDVFVIFIEIEDSCKQMPGGAQVGELSHTEHLC